MTTTSHDADELLSPAASAGLLSRVRSEIARLIVGQERVVERVMVGLLAGGHCLLEGAPGLGKTRLLTTLSTAIGGEFSRIQFTPDLLPSDIVGTRIYQAHEGTFSVDLGPVFANIVLADEINRAPAKVQSALLEVMAEKQVTIGGDTYEVPRPFLVLATQNPIESEGVYQLPEAQRDRFLMKIPVDYPAGPHEEMEIVRRAAGESLSPREVISLDEVKALQATARAIHVDPRVADYAVRLVLATREPTRLGLDVLEPLIAFGASPRASIGLVEGARALAMLRGRGSIEPQDIYDIAYDVLNHRIVMSFDAVADGVTVDEVLYHLLTTIPAPQAGGPGVGQQGPQHQGPRHQGPQHGQPAAGPPPLPGPVPSAGPVPPTAAQRTVDQHPTDHAADAPSSRGTSLPGAAPSTPAGGGFGDRGTSGPGAAPSTPAGGGFGDRGTSLPGAAPSAPETDRDTGADGGSADAGGQDGGQGRGPDGDRDDGGARPMDPPS